MFVQVAFKGEAMIQFDTNISGPLIKPKSSRVALHRQLVFYHVVLNRRTVVVVDSSSLPFLNFGWMHLITSRCSFWCPSSLCTGTIPLSLYINALPDHLKYMVRMCADDAI